MRRADKLTSRQADLPTVNRHYFDRFSVVHAAVGALAEISAIPAPLALGGAVLFEVVENNVKAETRALWPDPRPDSVENQIGDVASFAAGYYGARALAPSPAGQVTLIGLGALAAAIWMGSLLPQRGSSL